MRILLAEDEVVSRTLIARVLRDLGHEVTDVEDGEAAWRAYQVEPYKVVLTDWLMPRCDGLELIQRIRGQEDKNYTYILMLTANSSEREQYLEAMEAGADDFLPKPLDRIELEVRLGVASRILDANSRIHSLESALTICAYTKQVNIPDEGWQTIETFLRRHLGLSLSHGVEPGHYETVIRPQLEAMKRQSGSGA